MKALELQGIRFGRLIVCRRDGSTRRKIKWECLCDCGKTSVVETSQLRGGKTKSCGCLRQGVKPTHGMTKTTEYHSWSHMIARCENRHDKRYHRYGGRGITVCARWRQNFMAFYADMGQRPGPGHSIDRINNDGDYEPGNCRWATAKQQGRNASFVRLSEGKVADIRRRCAAGESQNSIAVELGVSRSTIHVAIKEKTWT